MKVTKYYPSYLWDIRENTCFWRISNESDFLLNTDEKQKCSKAVSNSQWQSFSCLSLQHEGVQVSAAAENSCSRPDDSTQDFTCVAVYESWIAALESLGVVSALRAQCSSGFHMAHRKTCQLHLWAKQLDNQTEHLVSVLVLLFGEEGAGRLWTPTYTCIFVGLSFKWESIYTILV